MKEIEIERINTYKDQRFSENVLLQHGAFLVNGKEPYEVEIVSDHAAIVRGSNSEFFDQIIEEFRFFAEHISLFYNTDGKLIKGYEDVKRFMVSLEEIQPSQFYVDTLKKKAVESFINEGADVIIPLIKYQGRYVSLDGHTRMAVAMDKGISTVFGFLTQADDYIYAFVEEAKRRNIHSPYDMTELSHEEYDVEWNQFCDNFFQK